MLGGGFLNGGGGFSIGGGGEASEAGEAVDLLQSVRPGDNIQILALPPSGSNRIEIRAYPAGQNGWIQFNDNQKYGASQNLFWDDQYSRLVVTGQTWITTQDAQSTLSVARRDSSEESTDFNDPAIQYWGSSPGGPYTQFALGINANRDVWMQVRGAGDRHLLLNPLGGEVFTGGTVTMGISTDNSAVFHPDQDSNTFGISAENGLNLEARNGPLWLSLRRENPTASFPTGGAVISDQWDASIRFGTLGPPEAGWMQAIDSSFVGSPMTLLLNPLGGFVGINKQNPITTLDVHGPIRSTSTGPSPTSGAGLEISGSASGCNIQAINRGNGNWLELAVSSTVLYLYASWGITVGSWNQPQYKVDVYGDVNIRGVLRINGVQVLP